MASVETIASVAHRAMEAQRVLACDVAAAIVVESKNECGETRVFAVSVASGTRAVGTDEKRNATPLDAAWRLGDGHAEVLARRGFVAALLSAVAARRSGGGLASPLAALVEEVALCAGQWRLRESTLIHLVVTEPPCGDAAMVGDAAPTGAHALLATPSGKVLTNAAPASGGSDDKSQERAHMGHVLAAHMHSGTKTRVAVARTKPGAGIPALHMSCSDKILRWQCCSGLQGAIAGLIFPERMALSTIVVAPRSGRPVADASGLSIAMDRAFNDRWPQLPRPRIRCAVVPCAAAFDGAASDSVARPAQSSAFWMVSRVVIDADVARKRQRDADASGPSGPTWAGVTLNTKEGLPLGMTAAAFAKLADNTKATALPEPPHELARLAIARRVVELLPDGAKGKNVRTYADLKLCNDAYQQRWRDATAADGHLWVEKQRCTFCI